MRRVSGKTQLRLAALLLDSPDELAVRRAAGLVVFEVSAAELVAACSGGWLLGVRPPLVAVLSINTSPRL